MNTGKGRNVSALAYQTGNLLHSAIIEYDLQLGLELDLHPNNRSVAN